MIHYHGCPITPGTVLQELAGKFFCNSFAAPNQTKTCHAIGQGNMLDNGAFSVWKRGDYSPDWNKWAEWVDPWLDYHTTWCVLPDSIEGDLDDNKHLIDKWSWVRSGAPVWHLHEPLEWLQELAYDYPRICFGSSGQYASVGTELWHLRVCEAFNALADQDGKIPVWVHMLRGMSLAGGPYPFASVDSTDVARNHNREHNNALEMASRWDAIQCGARWIPREQLKLEVA